MSLRSPICTVVGHVDHGKSSILDNIRRSNIVAGEAGKITQHIGASIIPLKNIKTICGELLETTKMNFTIPGLLFIDTPGHAAFTHSRKRGGNLADIAILVVDIKEGFKPQTIESIEILKSYKTPFIVAANKIDLLPGWKQGSGSILKNIQLQNPDVLKTVETKLYELVGKLSEFGLESERFDRVEDYTKQIAIVPVSAHTGEGIPELLMVISGLAQRFLEQCLQCNVKGSAKGTILEIKEEKGLGITADAILYDGTLKVNDTIIIGGVEKATITKVRALFEPQPLKEMRDKKGKFLSVKEAVAATGVKISAPELNNIISGMPIRSADKCDVEKVAKEIQNEVEEVLVQTEDDGIILKADTLGSLEALTNLVREQGYKVRKASVGPITKKDIVDAESNLEKDPLTALVIGFNVYLMPDVKVSDDIQVITSDVIYKLVDDLDEFVKEQKKKMELKSLEELTFPCKIEVLKGYVFRQNNPAIIGCHVLSGKAKVGMQLMKDNGVAITTIKSMQKEKDSAKELKQNEQAAIAMVDVTVGRQVNEGDTLFSFLTETEFRQFKENKHLLSDKEKELLKEICSIMRKENPVWGV